MSSTLTIIDVGHGASTVIEDEQDITIIDTGESTALIDYLASKNISVINYLFLSHVDKDHIAKALKLLTVKKFTINNIVLNSDSAKDSKLWKDLAYEIEQQDNINELNSIIGVKAKDSFKLGTSLELQVLSPSPEITMIGAGGKTKTGEKITSNTISLYASIVKDKKNIVGLTSDIDEIAINHFSDVIQKSIETKFLVFPHHGGYCGNTTAYSKLLDYTQPDYVIFSNGSRFDNPRKENIDIIKSKKKVPKIMCTELSKNCLVCSEQQKICAGNISINLDNYSIISPIEETYFHNLEAYQSRMCK